MAFNITRRTVIKGAGTVAIALPWLEIMRGSRRAQAQTASVPLKRFVTVYQPGGTVRQGTLGDKYTPTGTETAFTLSPILMPLSAFQSRLLIVDGTNLTCGDQSKYNVEQHQGGEVGWLTGAIQMGATNWIPKNFPSIDQALAARLSAGKAMPTGLQVAVRWGTGTSKGKLAPQCTMNFDLSGNPIPPRLDPQDIFKTLFGSPTTGGGGTTGADPNLLAARRKSVLDYVDRKYDTLKVKLGMDDRARLDQHLTQLRSIEQRLTMLSTPMTQTSSCKTPVQVDTTGYNPTSALNGVFNGPNGSNLDPTTDMKIPVVGQFMMDMITMALACDRTGVASMQWSDSEAKHTFPWLSLPEHHHYYQHDGGFRPAECTQIDTWYSSMHAYFLKALQAVDMGGHTLLDETLLLFGTELGDPPSHNKTNVPLMLAGGDGKTIRTGRWIKCGGVPHNKLLTGILNAFGDTRTSFGDPKIDSAALNNLG